MGVSFLLLRLNTLHIKQLLIEGLPLRIEGLI